MTLSAEELEAIKRNIDILLWEHAYYKAHKENWEAIYTALLDGFNARRDGKGREDNPFDYHAHSQQEANHDAWDNGWTLADWPDQMIELLRNMPGSTGTLKEYQEWRARAQKILNEEPRGVQWDRK